MEKYLFGAILGLLLLIAGLGVYTVIQHPTETAALVPEAVSVVQTAVVDATNTITGAAVTSSDTAKANDSDDENEDASEELDDDRAVAAQPTSATPPAQEQTSTTQPSGTYAMAQVKAHNSASSCYTVVSGSVYDLTSFIRQHPGGQAAILSLCGTDGTAAFTAQHGGERRPANELASLKIGVLAK